MRAEELVRRNGEEVRSESSDIEEAVRRVVNRVDIGQSAYPVSSADQPFEIGDGPNRVRGSGGGHEAGAPVDDLGYLLDLKPASILRIEVDPSDFNAGVPCRYDPRPHVCVVVQSGDHDVVPDHPRCREGSADRQRERGHVLSERDLVRRSSDEIGDRLARRRSDRVGFARRHKGSAVVASPHTHEVRHRIDDGLRDLRSPRPIEIGSRLPINVPRECRELTANGLNVERHGCLQVGRPTLLRYPDAPLVASCEAATHPLGVHAESRGDSSS